MLHCLCCMTCNDPFPGPGSNSVIFLSLELYNNMPYLQLCLLNSLLNGSDWHNKTCRLWSYGNQDMLEPNQWWKIHCICSYCRCTYFTVDMGLSFLQCCLKILPSVTIAYA